MSKKLVAYFSASGVTAALAERLAVAIDADLFEIEPCDRYTEEDLDWTNPESRSSIEMKVKELRPAIMGAPDNLDEYDEVFLGFPIWWYVAPTVVNAFLEAGDFAGKKIALFATSGTSGMGDTMAELEPSAPDAEWVGEKRFDANASADELAAWTAGLEL